MSKIWSNAKHEESLKRRRLKKLEKNQKRVPPMRTDMFDYGNKSNEISTKTEFDN